MMTELSFLNEEKKRHQKLAILIHLVYKSLMRTFMAMVYWFTTRTHIDPISC